MDHIEAPGDNDGVCAVGPGDGSILGYAATDCGEADHRESVTATPDTRSFCERALGFVHQWFNDRPLPRPQEAGLSVGGKITQGHEGLECLIKQEMICAPTTTEADIKDRSKGDTISKTVVILQTTWFVLQCIMRWSHGLTVTELEVVTLGFALLNGITYWVWWEKPQGVGVPVYLERRVMKELERVAQSKAVVREEPEASKALEDDSKPTGHDEADTTPPTASNTPVPSKKSFLLRKLAKDRGEHSSYQFWTFDILNRLIQALLRSLGKIMDDTVIAEGSLCVPMFYAAVIKPSEDTIIVYTSSLIAVLFGGVHLIPAWFLPFPSSTEMWLWRISAVVVTTEPVLLPVGGILENHDNSISNVAKIIIFIPVVMGLPLYIFARVILITLSFTTLRALPSDVYHTID